MSFAARDTSPFSRRIRHASPEATQAAPQEYSGQAEQHRDDRRPGILFEKVHGAFSSAVTLCPAIDRFHAGRVSKVCPSQTHQRAASIYALRPTSAAVPGSRPFRDRATVQWPPVLASRLKPALPPETLPARSSPEACRRLGRRVTPCKVVCRLQSCRAGTPVRQASAF